MDRVPGARQLRVRQMVWEAEGVLSLTLLAEDGAELPPWEVGAHIDLVLRPELIRQYSLCGRPDRRHEWKVAVLLEQPSAGGSAYIHEVLRPGMVVAATGPRNNFPLVDADHYLFVAGGIGVTPLVPMVQATAAAGADWRLLYGGRRRASMAFVDELTALGPRVTIAPEDECGLLDLQTAIDAMPDGSAVYCCGPEPLIAAVEARCADGRVDLHVERFGSRPGFTPADTADDEPFELVLADSGRRLTVRAEQTIVAALEEAGVFTPTSCSEGYCGVCETEVISGTPDHRDDYLTEEAKAANKTMMICVGRSKTAELVIRL